MDIETFEKCRLVDIKFSKNIERFFYKPVYGLSGMRNKVNSYDKPLFGSIIKPKTGINKLVLHLSSSDDSYLAGARTDSSPRHPRLTRATIPVSACLREAAGVRRDPTALRRRP